MDDARNGSADAGTMAGMTRTPDVPLLDSPEATVDALDLFIGPEDRRRRSLWILWLDAEGRPAPVVVPIDDLPELPEARTLDAVMGVISVQADPDGSVLLTLTRPGPRSVGAADRAWFEAIHRAARAAELAVRPLHLATPEGTLALHLDDVI